MQYDRLAPRKKEREMKKRIRRINVTFSAMSCLWYLDVYGIVMKTVDELKIVSGLVIENADSFLSTYKNTTQQGGFNNLPGDAFMV